MAYYEKLEGAALQAYREMVRTLKEKAMKELKLSEGELITRMLRSDDIGASVASSTFNVSAAGWNTIIDSKTVADNRFVGINGVLVAESGTSVVSQLRITKMGDIKRYWVIQDVNFLESPVVYFDDPITVDQNTTIKVEAYGMATDSEWRCNFIGAVVEKKGLLVA